MAVLAKDPVLFCESLFNIRLWDQQKAIIRSIASDRRVAIRGAHATGKSFCVAAAIIWWAVRHRQSRVITLAPGWLQTKSVLWAEIHSLLSKARYRLPAQQVNLTEIRLGADNQILGLSTNEASRLSGFHGANVLFVIDECVAIDESFFPAVMGVLAGGNAHLVVLSNPTVNVGYFADCFGRNAESWTKFTLSGFDVPNMHGVDLDRLLHMSDAELDDNPWPFLTTRRWVRDRYHEWFRGSVTNSPQWASRVLAQFPSSSSNALIPLPWLEAARRPAIDNHADVVVGIDVAGAGRDRTVCCACAGGGILELAIYSDADAVPPVLNFLRRWSRRVRLVRLDSAGVGYYFTNHIRNAGFRVEPINVSSAPLDKERFANAKGERYWHLRERFERGEISGLSDDGLSELAAIDYLIAPNGKTAIADKETVKAALGKSPDIAEAIMLCLGEEVYSGPLMQTAPSSSWQQARDPRSPSRLYGQAAPWDDAEDNIYGGGSSGIQFVRSARSRWSVF
jgi:hypothetical protein